MERANGQLFLFEVEEKKKRKYTKKEAVKPQPINVNFLATKLTPEQKTFFEELKRRYNDKVAINYASLVTSPRYWIRQPKSATLELELNELEQIINNLPAEEFTHELNLTF